MKYFNFFLYIFFLIATLKQESLLANYISKGLLKCESKNFRSNTFFLDTSFNAHLIFDTKKKQYSLSQLNFKFSIFELFENQKNIWYEKEVYNLEHKENLLYQPKRYYDHIQFKNIAEKQIFGKISILLAKSKLRPKFVIDAKIIYSNILDHWGGTVKAECMLTLN